MNEEKIDEQRNEAGAEVPFSEKQQFLNQVDNQNLKSQIDFSETDQNNQTSDLIHDVQKVNNLVGLKRTFNQNFELCPETDVLQIQNQNSSNQISESQQKKIEDQNEVQLLQKTDLQNQLNIKENLIEAEVDLKIDQNQLKRQKVENSQNVKQIQKVKKLKRVRWVSDNELEQVKVFMLTNLPKDQTLQPSQINTIQTLIENIPRDKILSQLLQNKDKIIQCSNQSKEQNKPQDRYMQPQTKYHRQLLQKFNAQPQKIVYTAEQEIQSNREMTVFSYQEAHFQKGSPLLENPQKQQDVVDCCKNELNYFSDIDLELIYNDRLKSIEIQKFQKDFDILLNSSDVNSLSSEQNQNLQKQIQNYIVQYNQQSPQSKSMKSLVKIRLNHQHNLQSLKQQIYQLKQRNQFDANEKQEKENFQDHQVNQHIKVDNRKTVPCKNYHGPQGCQRGDFCNFIHVKEYEKQQLPREVFFQHRNENIRKNQLEAIKKVQPQAAEQLSKVECNQYAISNFIQNWNQQIEKQQQMPQQSNQAQQILGQQMLFQNQLIQNQILNQKNQFQQQYQKQPLILQQQNQYQIVDPNHLIQQQMILQQLQIKQQQLTPAPIFQIDHIQMINQGFQQQILQLQQGLIIAQTQRNENQINFIKHQILQKEIQRQQTIHELQLKLQQNQQKIQTNINEAPTIEILSNISSESSTQLQNLQVFGQQNYIKQQLIQDPQKQSNDQLI